MAVKVSEICRYCHRPAQFAWRYGRIAPLCSLHFWKEVNAFLSVNKPGHKRGQGKLSDTDVLIMRHEYRQLKASGAKVSHYLRQRASLHNTSVNAIRQAAKGITYRHLEDTAV